MAVNAIYSGRVTATLKTDALLTALRRNTAQLFTEQNRLSVGRQFITPSDDPGRAARALNLSEILVQQDQLVTNIRHGANTLDAADVAMAEVSQLVIDAYAIASQNIGTLSSPEERSAAAEVVASIRDQVVAVGNRTFEGRYLFAGRLTDVQPFARSDAGVVYQGDQGYIFARTDVNELEPINLTGDVLFGALSSEVRGTVDLDPIVTADTRLENLRGAVNQGVRLGTIQLVEDGQSPIAVDLSTADTVGDLVDLINRAAADAGSGVSAAVTDVGISIAPAGPALIVRDVSTGTTAADLGIRTTTATNALILGTDLDPVLTRTSPVTALAAGAGIDLSAGLVISNGHLSAVIDTSAAETIQDILNAINNAGVHAQATISEDGKHLNVVNANSGTSMGIGENGGTTATALGLRSLIADTRLDALNNGEGVRISEGVSDLEIRAADGSAFEVNLDGAEAISDVLAAINAAATAAGVAITADLAAVGNGIRLVDGTGGAGAVSVLRASNSEAGFDLGVLGDGVTGAAEWVGNDANPARANGLLTALIDLETALRDDDSIGITLASEAIDAHQVEFNRARGIVGARAKGMQDRLAQTENAAFATQALLSEVEDLDYTESVTRFQQAQTALEASLLAGSQIQNLSLIDFLR